MKSANKAFYYDATSCNSLINFFPKPGKEKKIPEKLEQKGMKHLPMLPYGETLKMLLSERSQTHTKTTYCIIPFT